VVVDVDILVQLHNSNATLSSSAAYGVCALPRPKRKAMPGLPSNCHRHHVSSNTDGVITF
jgi:hypothetical protein